jgi:oxygen-independent coproporphyrinogen-3 oxidase
MMNALRLTAGFTRQLFSERTGLSVETIQPALSDLEGEGLTEATNSGWRPSPRGQLFLNDVIARFLPRQNSQAGTGS